MAMLETALSPRQSASQKAPSLEAAVVSAAATPKPVLACRPMTEADVEAAIGLLCEGFPERRPDYWRAALDRLRDREVPKGWPRYGFVLTDHSKPVGIILTIFATTDTGVVRGNISSWYVAPAYRGYSNFLLAPVLRMKDVTLFNISPASNTLDTIRAQGFTQYASGSFQALAALAPRVPGARIRRVRPDTSGVPALLAEHAGWGCLSVTVTHDGETYPFVFVRSRFLGDRVPCAQLVYCRHIDEFVRFAGPLGRYLLSRGLPVVMLDAAGPIAALKGSYREGRGPRFYRGGTPPRLGDLSATELAIFGF